MAAAKPQAAAVHGAGSPRSLPRLCGARADAGPVFQFSDYVVGPDARRVSASLVRRTDGLLALGAARRGVTASGWKSPAHSPLIGRQVVGTAPPDFWCRASPSRRWSRRRLASSSSLRPAGSCNGRRWRPRSWPDRKRRKPSAEKVTTSPAAWPSPSKGMLSTRISSSHAEQSQPDPANPDASGSIPIPRPHASGMFRWNQMTDDRWLKARRGELNTQGGRTKGIEGILTRPAWKRHTRVLRRHAGL